MPHASTGDQLVEQAAIGLFAELGWQTVSAMEEIGPFLTNFGLDTQNCILQAGHN